MSIIARIVTATVLLSATACVDAELPSETAGLAGETSDADGSSDDGADDDAGDPPPSETPPTDGGPLASWLADGNYLAWAAESDVHASTGPHGSAGVRTFVNAKLFDSLAAGSDEHPVGAATVKELYGSSGVTGYAVLVKVEAGRGSTRWYWYERVGSTTYADGIDERLCTGCHAPGADQILTPYPLQ